MPPDRKPVLHVCLNCGFEPGEVAAAPGRALFDALQAEIETLGAAAPATLRGSICFANCERGCSAALSSPGKWSYLVGWLTPGHAADLLAYAAAYRASESGIVLRADRPESLHNAIVARFPAPGLDEAQTSSSQAIAPEPEEIVE